MHSAAAFMWRLLVGIPDDNSMLSVLVVSECHLQASEGVKWAVFPYLTERKRCDDLAKSIVDGRLHRQALVMNTVASALSPNSMSVEVLVEGQVACIQPVDSC